MTTGLLGPRTGHRSGGAGWGFLFAKRSIDLLVAGAVLIVSAPVLAVLALAIKLDSPGPVLYGSYRTGRDGRRFRMWKLRTMRVDADEIKEQLRHLSLVPWPDFKMVNDPRVTRVGRFLRRSSLDELPQMWNVLVGDMSLVGPRPTSFKHDTYDLWHTARLEVRPGLTGLWQVSERRGACDMDERLRLDLAYIETMSLTTDLKVLALTAGAVLKGTGS